MKAYVAPKSVVLSMNMKENIAASTISVTWNNQYYLIDGKIQDTGFEYANEPGTSYYDSFMDFLFEKFGGKLEYDEYKAYAKACAV